MKANCLLKLPLALITLPVVALEIPYANARADGPLNVSANREINLDGAATRAWDAAPEFAGSGVYDTNQWAVVFKYSSVDIATGATVTFKNHDSRAPVVWLVDGDVTINGTLNLSGQSNDTDVLSFRLVEPGPGGFRGGDSFVNAAETGSGGFGPGGSFDYTGGPNGQSSHATAGQASNVGISPTYGNFRILPLIGGSGGAGFRGGHGWGGGAGGGAILIAASGRITVNGSVLANGGHGTLAGSGGAIRLIAESVSGVGRLEAVGGTNGGTPTAGSGRIRIETPDYTAQFTALMPITEPELPDSPVQLWPAADAPKARIVSVSGLGAPTDPRASMGAPDSRRADVRAVSGGTGEIIVETDNLPSNATVFVRVTPRSGAAFELQAAFVSDTATPGRRLWRAQTNLNPGYCAMQVRAVTP